ncbi:chondroitin AC/alginate lyase [Halteromyces radiatus]|uniref:chondroitin AC/alginate lyase n=1 Tax=Halteromyces radiatus TaxID=101107 RepID=UPI0022204A7F|nr:chondroitin AC/alginate lyase [Halteromyces radiatus]KAI8092674.1 chondroitin AC/alginate lyase [Halteromyces radiatus]
MILVILFLITCVESYLYYKKQYQLGLSIGCIFFLWYAWNTAYPIFTFSHEPILITSTVSSSSSSASSSSGTDHPSSKQQQNQSISYGSNESYPIHLKIITTSLQSSDLSHILINKNLINANSNKEKQNGFIWSSTLNTSGLWSDIDYTSGCLVRKTGWSAINHLKRIESMASIWYHQQEDRILLSHILQALQYWFTHDYTNDDCLLYGGQAYKNCPCGTIGLWSRAWESQVIEVPRYIGNICLLINNELSSAQRKQCIKFTSRSYSVVDQYSGVDLLNIVHNGISLALLQSNPLLIQDALDRVSKDVVIAPNGKDGIQVDGSYLFHDAQLYNGNYGEAYILDLINIFDMMRNASSWFPSNTTQQSFATLLSGSEWMMFGTNLSSSSLTSSVVRSPWLWQYNVLGRMISYRTSDLQGTDGVALNIMQLNGILQSWSAIHINASTIGNKTTNATTTTGNVIQPEIRALSSMIQRLDHPYTSANQGPLMGTRYFWNADYLVHRCHGFITTLKMISTRTTTCECFNGQNLKGGYLNDGSLFTYQQGDDYVDIFGAWDWKKIPGVTMINNNSSSSSRCEKANRFKGKTSFVGAATLQSSQMGVAVMNYTDPLDDDPGAFGWHKTFIFFPSVYAVQMDVVSYDNHNSSSSSSVMMVNTTLDQRRRRGDIYLNGKRLQQPNGIYHNVTTVWHDKILYTFDMPVNLTMDATSHPSDWTSFGVSNNKTKENVDIWSVTVMTTKTLTYTVQPNYRLHRHQSEPPLEFIYTEDVRGAFSATEHSVMLAFWAPASISIPWSHDDDEGDDGTDIFIETIHPLVLCLQQQVGNGTWVVSISDPTQSLSSTNIKISIDQEEAPIQYDVIFPQDQRGSSVTMILQDEP